MKKSPSKTAGLTIPQILAVIRRERERKGLTYAAAAEAIGTSQPAWHSVENGRRPASEEFLQRMAESLGLNLEFFTVAKMTRADGKRILPPREKKNAKKKQAED